MATHDDLTRQLGARPSTEGVCKGFNTYLGSFETNDIPDHFYTKLYQKRNLEYDRIFCSNEVDLLETETDQCIPHFQIVMAVFPKICSEIEEAFAHRCMAIATLNEGGQCGPETTKKFRLLAMC